MTLLSTSIQALDPAMPGFIFAGPGAGVTASDAPNVHVIHTNAGGLGLTRRAGTADFYPNGGSSQPGCGIDLYGEKKENFTISLPY